MDARAWKREQGRSAPQRPAPSAGFATPAGEKPVIMLVGLFPPAQGGMTSFLLNLVNSDLAQSYRFAEFNIARPPKKNVADNWGYAAVLRGGVGRIAVGLAVTLAHLASFPFAVRRRHADLVQVQASDYQQFWEAFCYVLLARRLGRPVLMRLGGAFDRFYAGSSAWMKRRLRNAVARPDLLIVQSAYWRDFLATLGRTERVVVLNNFVLDAAISPPRTSVTRSPRCLFIAGTEARRKGVDVLIEALRLLRQRRISAPLVAIAMPESAARKIRASGLDDMVELRGSLPREDVLAEMRRADIFLLPSFGEGFPNSLLEAMAQGMAAVVTPVGSVPDVVRDSENAIVIPSGDAVALADAIAALIARPDLCAEMGVRNRELVKSRFSAQAVLPALDSAYRQLLRAAAHART